METDERTELENHLDVAILAQSFALQHVEFATEEEGKDLDRIIGTIQRLMGKAAEGGLADRVQRSEGDDFWMLTKHPQNEAIIRLTMEVRASTAMEYLAGALAGRDVNRRMEKEGIDEGKQEQLVDDWFEDAFSRYEREFGDHALERLEVVPRRPDNAKDFGFTPMPREIPAETIYGAPDQAIGAEVDAAGLDALALALERRIAQIDNEAAEAGLALTDSQARSTLMKVRKKWEGGNPGVLREGLRDALLAKMYDHVAAFPEDFRPKGDGHNSALWEEIGSKLFLSALEVVEERIESCRTTVPGSRLYLDGLPEAIEANAGAAEG